MTYYYAASAAVTETAAVLMLECRSISFRAQWIQQQQRQSHFSARSLCTAHLLQIHQKIIGNQHSC